MAEMCWDCFKKEEPAAKESQYIISKDLDIFEFCGEEKQVVVREK